MNYKAILSKLVTLAFGEFSSKAFGFFTMVYLARVLGADNFGMVGFVSAISGYVLLFANFGIEQYAARLLATGQLRESGHLIGSVLKSRLFLSLIFIVPFIIFGILYSAQSVVQWLFIFQSLFILANAFNLQFYFIAEKKILTLAILKTSVSFSILLCSIIFVKSTSDLARVTFISGTVTLLFYASMVKYLFSKRIIVYSQYSFPNIVNMLKKSAPLGVSALMIQIYYSADIVFLGFTNPGIDLGYYTGVYRIILLFTAIPGIIYMIFLPDLAKINSGHFHHRITRNYIGLLFGLGCILPMIAYIFSRNIITLVLGISYIPAVGVFNISLLNVFLVFVNVSLAHLLIVWDKQHKYLTVVASGAIVNILSNIIMIPLFGIYGAAISTVFAECAVLVMTLFYHRTIFGLFKKEDLISCEV